MSEMRAPAEARAIAEQLPPADEARVRDLLAAAGPGLAQALSNLAGAVACAVAERADLPVQRVILGAVAVRMARDAVLRSATRGRA